MKILKTLVCVVGFCLPAFATASAGTSFSNLGQSVDGAGFLPFATRRLATDFQTGPDLTIITGASLRLLNPDPIPHTYTSSLWSDNAGFPGTMVGAFAPITLAAGTSGDFATTPVGNITLTASTAYWEVLQVNEDRIFVIDSEWKFTTSPGIDSGSVFSTIASTTPKVSVDSGATWSTLAAGNFQFALSGVPEPAGGLLLLVGAPLLLAIRRGGKRARKDCHV